MTLIIERSMKTICIVMLDAALCSCYDSDMSKQLLSLNLLLAP